MFSSNGPSIPSRDRAIIYDYAAAAAFLDKRETNSHRFGRQEGWIERMTAGDAIGIRYHDTQVIVLHPNGDTTFYTGGWHTISTSNWIRSNPRFDCTLYEPRSGERKPFRYSMIRFKGHDLNIEQKFRDQFGLPSVREQKWISAYDYSGDFTGNYDDRGRPIYTNGKPEMQAKVRAMRDAATTEKMRRHPYYVFKEGIGFTKRGRCVDGTLLRDAIAEERRERAETVAARRKARGAITRFTNRTMKALTQGGLPIEDEPPASQAELRTLVERAEPHGALIMKIVARTRREADVRAWLNFREEGGQVVMGEIAPIVEPILRRTLRDSLAKELVPRL